MPSEVGRFAQGMLFLPIMADDGLLAATGDEAWLEAMLAFEAALARAEARCGLIPQEAAAAIGEACDARLYDVASIGLAARGGGNPAIALVCAIREHVAAEHRGAVHLGAASQDVVDTAMVKVAREAAGLIDASLAGLAKAARDLAARHRSTPMTGRTLMQEALPITFGLKAAQWHLEVEEARTDLRRAASMMGLQLGGAVGSLEALGDRAPEVARLVAEELGLRAPVAPWQANRLPVARLAAALALVAGACGKVAKDVILLAATEVGEVAEPAAPGRGVSSSMPHKRNPVLSTAALAAAGMAPSLSSILLSGLVAEHERPAGAWHAEWQSLVLLLRVAGGAAARMAEAVGGLQVFPERMRSHMGAGSEDGRAVAAAAALVDRILADAPRGEA